MLKNLRIYEDKIEAVAKDSQMMKQDVDQICDDIIDKAKAVFLTEEVKGNESRTSSTSPPKYLESFGKEEKNGRWYVYNDDPGALMVEFGALAGGQTEVLKYSPLRRALDEASGVDS